MTGRQAEAGRLPRPGTLGWLVVLLMAAQALAASSVVSFRIVNPQGRPVECRVREFRDDRTDFASTFEGLRSKSIPNGTYAYTLRCRYDVVVGSTRIGSHRVFVHEVLDLGYSADPFGLNVLRGKVVGLSKACGSGWLDVTGAFSGTPAASFEIGSDGTFEIVGSGAGIHIFTLICDGSVRHVQTVGLPFGRRESTLTIQVGAPPEVLWPK